jgi:iron complex outermembrane receptor protein
MQIGLSDAAEQAGSVYLSSTNINLDPPHTKRVNSHFEQLRWLHSSAAAHEYSLRFYHDYHNTDEDYRTEPVALLGGTQIPISTDILAERYDLEFQSTHTPRQNLRLVWGASARQDQVTAPTFFATTRRLDSTLYRLFGNLEWHLTPALVANVGAMQEHTDITGSKLSPRLALNYHVTEHQTVRAVVSRATRTPILFEEQANLKFEAGPLTDQLGLSTVNLDSERIDAHELGYLFYWPARGTSLDVKIFHDLLRGIIRSEKICTDSLADCLLKNGSVDNVDGNYNHFRNADHVTVHGLEFQIDQHLGAATRIVAGYAHTRITGRDSDPALLQSAPVDSYHVLLIGQLPRDTTVSLAYYQFGDMQYLDFGNHTAAQHRLDLRLAHVFRLDDNRISLALTVQNLLGSYQDFYYNKDLKNLFDRRAFVELAWELP